MPHRIYIVNPTHDYPSYSTSEVLEAQGYRPASLTPELNLPTLSPMAAPHLDVRICDELVTPIDWDTPADIVAITGKISQLHRIRTVAAEFRRRGKTVVIGGPQASMNPQSVREYCDVLVKGEIEEIADEIFGDLAAGRIRDEYSGSRPDLSLSPLPDWTSYPNDRAMGGIIQVSRGCPFECEFCDVPVYLGRKQRHKTDEQITGELDNLYELGYRSCYIADDNFTATRKRAKQILESLEAWNGRQADGPMTFYTPVSLDAAKDEEMLEHMKAAGLTGVFIGIETPNVDSLKETKKRQNLHVDIQTQCQRFLDFGMAITGGMICGFDNDGPDIFEQQFEFAQASPIPIFTMGALVALIQTPLYDRLSREGRLIQETADMKQYARPSFSNVVPIKMSSDELTVGVRWLINRLYHPHNFGERMVSMIEKLAVRRGFQAGATANPNRPRRSVESDVAAVIAGIASVGPDEALMMERINKARARRPDVEAAVQGSLFRYMQIRHMFAQESYWDPHLATSETPDLSMPPPVIPLRRAPGPTALAKS